MVRRARHSSLLVVVIWLFPVTLLAWDEGAPAGFSEAEVANAVDVAIARRLAERHVEPASLARDEDFLRRVSLDLVGTIPTPNEVTLFMLDPSEDKRAVLIERLLADERFSQTWAAYWRDVIFSRATDMRARIAQPTFERWLREQWAAHRSWDEITREILTASGEVRSEGATGLIFAHFGDASELAGETARIFLGIQLSCANCHDHPYDSWTRKQFHELAAFFPRIQVRQDLNSEVRTFVVVSNDVSPRRGQQQAFDLDRLFAMLDRNRDGLLTREEASAQTQFPLDRLFELGDANRDGVLTREELRNIPRPEIMPPPGRGSAEHYMPNLERPQERGQLIQPAFFVSGETVALGTNDLQRRQKLAEFITSPENPWFAKAFVNRTWSELLGQGFYPLVDDMGPDREAEHSEALDLLAQGFIESGYNIRWLFRTITLTKTYQREMRYRDPSESLPPFAAAIPTRLRADQIYNSLLQVFGVTGINMRGPGGRGFGSGSFGGDQGRTTFTQVFGYDPSTPQADLIGSIPQALLMMNSSSIEGLIQAERGSRLRRILSEYSNNADALAELYLLVLSREPTTAEQQICLSHVNQVSERQEAFEDIFWSLINSTEFLTKR